MTPTIGRTVHFNPTEVCEKCFGRGPVAAIVTRVHSPTTVNLKILWDGPESSHLTSVVQDETGTQRFSWRWPPRA